MNFQSVSDQRHGGLFADSISDLFIIHPFLSILVYTLTGLFAFRLYFLKVSRLAYCQLSQCLLGTLSQISLKSHNSGHLFNRLNLKLSFTKLIKEIFLYSTYLCVNKDLKQIITKIE